MKPKIDKVESVDIYELYQRRIVLYRWYKRDKITLVEYLELIKPLDHNIDKIEMSTLLNILISKESFE